LLTAVTPLYTAPETFEGRPSAYSDQYSLAVTYHELLTGELPVQGKNLRQVILQVCTGQHDLSRLPEGDREVVARAMSKDPVQRFPSGQEFIDALAGLGGQPLERPGSGQHARLGITPFAGSIDELTNTTAFPSETVASPGVSPSPSKAVPAVAPAAAADTPAPSSQ